MRWGWCSIAVAALIAGPAQANSTLEEIDRQCNLQLPLSEKGCQCIVDQARDNLSLEQQKMLVAKVTRNQAAERALNLSADEMQEVIVFIRTTPDACGP